MSTTRSTVFFSIIIICAAVFYSFYSLAPQASWKGNIDFPDFSVERARNDLKEISQKPHFPGTEDHNRVRDYLVKELEVLGLEVEIQEQVAINKKWRAATNTRNVLAKIKGSSQGKALLLLSHYDSNPHSAIGASDAGSGVVVILEAVRAFLATGKTPVNDIIVCFSDAEELGLLGANAFVNFHPWAKDVGLVLNLEARGSGGPSYMLLETNGGNKELIEAFSNSDTEFPVGNSMMYSIYKMLPNDTDLTVFREDGDIDGFNFAFIGDHFDYHTEQDTFERMDLSSFLHQASYMLAGLSYFANAELNNFKADEDYVYFNFPVFGMVFYPFSWVLPWAIGCFLVFVVLFAFAISKKKTSIKEILKGIIPFGLALLLSGAVTFFGWKFLVFIHPQYNDILHGFTYNGYYYIAFFIGLTLTVCLVVYNRFFKSFSIEGLMLFPLFFWILINLGIAINLKGAGFFIIPVTAMLIELTILVFSKKKKTLLLFTLLSVPTLIMFVPLLKTLPVGLGLKMLVLSAFFTTLLFGFLIPVIQQYGNVKKGMVIIGMASIVFLVIAETNASYSEERKAPNSIVYVLDSNTGEAYWGTYNKRLDEFTNQFFEKKTQDGSFNKKATSSKYGTKIYQHAKAPAKNLLKPVINIVTDTIIREVQHIKLNIISNREANKFELLSNKPIQFKSFKVNGVALQNNKESTNVFQIKGGTIMSYYLSTPNEHLDIEFSVNANDAYEIDILEAKFDLLSNPEFEITPRTKEMIPMPFVLNDATIIKTTIKL